MANKIQQGHVNYLNQGLKATSLKNAFKDAVADGIESINITNLDTSKATDFNSMFLGCTVPVTINPIDMYNATDCDDMFFNTQVSGIHLKNVPHSNTLDRYNIGGTENETYIIDNYRDYIYDGVYGPIPDEETGLVDLSSYAKKYIKNYTSVYKIPEENLEYLNSGIKPTSLFEAFNDCRNLKSFSCSKLDVSNVTTMESMFDSCYRLTNVNLSNWNISSLTTMSFMFNYCGDLETLNITNVDTSNVENMGRMFYDCNNFDFTIIGYLDMSSCTDVTNMFKSGRPNLGVHLKNVPKSLDLSTSGGTEGRTYIIDNYID